MAEISKADVLRFLRAGAIRASKGEVLARFSAFKRECHMIGGIPQLVDAWGGTNLSVMRCLGGIGKVPGQAFTVA